MVLSFVESYFKTSLFAQFIVFIVNKLMINNFYPIKRRTIRDKYSDSNCDNCDFREPTLSGDTRNRSSASDAC